MHASPAPPPFAWTSGEIHADVLLGAGLLGAAYALAWARGPRVGATRPVAFLAGLGALLAALNGPLHDLSDYYLFSAHMVQPPVMTVVAAMITGAEQVLYPFYGAAPRLWGLTPLADQRLGGVIMWVPAGVIPLLAFTVVFFRWAAAEADEEPSPVGKPLL